MSKMVDLQKVHTFGELLSVEWLDCIERHPDGSARSYYIPDSTLEPGIQTLHHRVLVEENLSVIDLYLALKRVEELSDFPQCRVLLTGYKGKLYVKHKYISDQLPLTIIRGREKQAR